jgi:hypothetical protein
MNKKKLGTFLLAVFVFAAGISVVSFVQAVTGDPGTENDPLISSSYLENKLTEVRNLFDSKYGEIVTGIENNNKVILGRLDALEKGGGQGSGDKFQVVNVKSGSKLLCGSSTEFILRAGKAECVTTPMGGISNVTVGKDIKLGETIPLNHLIIVPRDDGRGLDAISDCVVMIRGNFQIE